VVGGNSHLSSFRYDHYDEEMARADKPVPGGFLPVLTINRNGAKPLHRQIYDGIRAMIVARNLRPGQQIPSTRALAVDLGISRIPVLNAYAQLLTEGYFESRVGSGTFVSRSLPDPPPLSGDGSSSANAGARVNRSGPRVLSRQAALLPDFHGTLWGPGAEPFSVGQLNFEHFPFTVWDGLVARHCRAVRAGDLNYGDPMGFRDFREAVAAYLRAARAVQCEAAQIMVVSGSQQALDICARVVLDPGSRVWIEEPGYPLMRYALEMRGCRPIPVPVDADGLEVSAGIRRCRTARAAFVTPSHQYPLGVTMSASRRLQLLDWAQSAGAWVVEDDYDSEYRYGNMPIASLQGLDRNARVLYIGTFSKTLFPALRLGYMVIPADLVGRFSAVRRVTDLCPPFLNQAVMTDFMAEGHFSRHIRKTRLLYSERRNALVDALGHEFESTLNVVGAPAGMHLVVTLPEGCSDREISAKAGESKGRDQKLRLWPLSPCYVGKRVRQGFILGFAGTTVADMPNAVRRLREALRPWL
jgi:GntR family transcriptional regulator/MocR family aminotransferase